MAYVIGGGCSDDGFTDFRTWLISMGRAVYEDALRDPESLAGVLSDEEPECEFEGFAYVASEIWEEKSTSEMPHGQQPIGDPTGEPWEEDEDVLEKRYPKLYARFG